MLHFRGTGEHVSKYFYIFIGRNVGNLPAGNREKCNTKVHFVGLVWNMFQSAL
jgi:hypothetical protein